MLKQRRNERGKKGQREEGVTARYEGRIGNKGKGGQCDVRHNNMESQHVSAHVVQPASTYIRKQE